MRCRPQGRRRLRGQRDERTIRVMSVILATAGFVRCHQIEQDRTLAALGHLGNAGYHQTRRRRFSLRNPVGAARFAAENISLGHRSRQSSDLHLHVDGEDGLTRSQFGQATTRRASAACT